ncbi:hypothetical protein K504DRAFT_173185 [Pleomassaria siparia CBS 279.74]|uniref:Uncharacterized protein n=1 Tax=Pleomassaria siparia CBS 279.74 TaxID=1314801 RepID=A0A6G1JTG3_9PLEO|nr:hypothetical protein K504DRAFT_173185 [Pleomassaria siparia CBS 279.74]
MEEDWKYYNVDEYNTWKRRQGQNFRCPPRENYIVAANHIKDVLDSKKLSWAAMCGLAMLCLGSRRDMPDLHIVYDDRDFQRIKSKLESDKRVSLPKGMVPLFPVKILIATGPKYKDMTCTENVEVELDLVPLGINGAPSTEDFRKHQILLQLKVNGKTHNFRGLNMLYLINTSVQYCKSQDLVWDPKRDITFLCQNYASEIKKVRHQLNQTDIQTSFLSTAYFAKLSPEDQRKCYNTLLDRDPPPMMSITPPPPQGDHKPPNPAQGQTQKPLPHLHKSSPPRKTPQPSNAFLSPPLLGKPKSQPAQNPQNSPANGTGQHAQLVPIYSANAANSDPRSRHRATSAPNAPNSTPANNPPTAQSGISRPMSMNSRPQSQAAFYSTAQLTKPQMVPLQGHPRKSMSASGMGGLAQKSMPNLKASQGPVGTIPLPSQTDMAIPLGLSVSHGSANHSSRAAISPGVATRGLCKSSAPASGLGLPPGLQNTDKPNPASPAGMPQKMALPGQRPKQHHNNNAGNSAADWKPTVAGSPSTQVAGLRLVGPEGLHKSADRPVQPAHAALTAPSKKSEHLRPLSCLAQHVPTPKQNTFVFELDAGPAQTITPAQAALRSMPPQELSGEPVAPKQRQSDTLEIAQQPQQVQSPPKAQLQAFPPPELAHLAHHVVSPPQPQQPFPFNASTLAPQAHNEIYPIEDLPPSLIAGGAFRQRSPSHSHQRSPERTRHDSPQLSPNLQVNASIYQNYSPSTSPSNGQVLPHAAPISEYKAYSASGAVSTPAVSASENLQRIQSSSVSPIVQSSAYIMPYSLPAVGPQAGTLTPPMSPPEKRDSHHSLQKQGEHPAPIVNASTYAAYTNQKNQELFTRLQTQMQKPRVGSQQPGSEVCFSKEQIQNPGQAQTQSMPAQVQPQPQARVQPAQSQLQPQLQHQAPPQESPQSATILPAPLQWTHAALAHHNYASQTQPQQPQLMQPQSQSQSQPQPIQATQPPPPPPIQSPPHPQPQFQQQQQAPQFQPQLVQAPPQQQSYTQLPIQQLPIQQLPIQQLPIMQPLQTHQLSHANMTLAYHDSPTTPLHNRNTSHGSDKLAQEYMSELPRYAERGYGSGGSAYSSEDESDGSSSKRRVASVKPLGEVVEKKKDTMISHEGSVYGGVYLAEGDKDVEKRDEQKDYLSRPEDGWKRDSGRGLGEGNGNGGKRISELYDFIDFT